MAAPRTVVPPVPRTKPVEPELGVAMVSNEAHHVKETLGKIVEALRSHPIAEFLDCEQEVAGA